MAAPADVATSDSVLATQYNTLVDYVETGHAHNGTDGARVAGAQVTLADAGNNWTTDRVENALDFIADNHDHSGDAGDGATIAYSSLSGRPGVYIFAAGTTVSPPQLTTGQNEQIERVRVPPSITALTSAYLVCYVRGASAGTFDWSLSTTWGAAGEAYNNDSDSATGNDISHAALDYELMALDVSAAFTGIAANDVITQMQITVSDFVTVTSVTPLGIALLFT